MNFECHVTIGKPNGPSFLEKCEALAEELNWRTSTIDGDPVLGSGPRFYFTTHAREYIGLYNKMDHLCLVLRKLGFTVLRKKIELVMFDSKDSSITPPSKDELT